MKSPGSATITSQPFADTKRKNKQTKPNKRKNKINHYNKQSRVLIANSTVCQSKWTPIVKPRRAKPKTYRQAPIHWLKFYEEAFIESEARTAFVQSFTPTEHISCVYHCRIKVEVASGPR